MAAFISAEYGGLGLIVLGRRGVWAVENLCCVVLPPKELGGLSGVEVERLSAAGAMAPSSRSM